MNQEQKFTNDESERESGTRREHATPHIYIDKCVYRARARTNDIKLEEIIFNQNALRMIKINGERHMETLNEPNSFWFKPIRFIYIYIYMFSSCSCCCCCCCGGDCGYSFSFLSFYCLHKSCCYLVRFRLVFFSINSVCWELSTISLAHTLFIHIHILCTLCSVQPQSKVQLNNIYITHSLNWMLFVFDKLLLKCTCLLQPLPFALTISKCKIESFIPQSYSTTQISLFSL